MATVKHFFVALGGNIPSLVGCPEITLQNAVSMLEKRCGNSLQVSRFYSTPCFPVGVGPDYVNAAARVAFDGTAAQLLAVLHEVEAEFGRDRIQRWGQRTLDLDLIAAGDEVLPDLATYEAWRMLSPERQRQEAPDQLILPHPRIQDRAFVLVPLADVAPDWCHPVLGQTVQQMLDALDPAEVAQVRPLTAA